MALRIDTTRRLRGSAARLQLVEAIRDAPSSEPETDWVEWKREANLSDKAWRGEAASHILGFSNREPARAAKATEGHAYLVLGVEPGKVHGANAYDPADIESWLNPYLGTANGPGWEADYVAIGGAQVLVISVDPPPEGHGAFPLRKAFTAPNGKKNYPDGEIFVRRNGKTVSEPSAAEMDMLNARAQRPRTGLDIRMNWANEGPVQAIQLSEDAQAEWLGNEKRRLLSVLGGSPVQLSRLAQDAITKASTLFGRETRSEDEYRQEVEEFIVEAEKELLAEAKARAVAAGHGLIELVIHNRTEENFEEVLVEARVRGDVSAYFDDEGSDFPSRPRKWGTGTALAPFAAPQMTYPITSHIPRPPRGYIDNSASARIVFNEFHLRPNYRVPLPKFFLMVSDALVGQELQLRWHATSKSVAGSITGDLTLPVASEYLSLQELMSS